MIELLFCVGAAYVIGAIPFGVLIARSRGIDIRQHGSGNIGATNVGRMLGARYGKLCLFLDILKGFVPTLAARFVLVHGEPDAVLLLRWLLVALAAVVGHVFPIYLGFRGGKGVATTIGAAVGVFPYFTIAMLIALLGYALVRYSTGYVSAGSITLATLFPLSVAAIIGASRELTMAAGWPLLVAAAVLGLLIIVRHRSNIARIFRGQEPTMNVNAPSAAERPADRPT